MKNRGSLEWCGLALAITIAVLACSKPATAAPPKVIELTMTSNLAQTSLNSQAMIFWAKELERRTNGQVKVGQMTWGGSLLKSDTIAQGIGKNIANVGYVAAVYIPSLLPISNAVFPVFVSEGVPWKNICMDLYKNEPQIHNEWAKLNIRPVFFIDFPPQLLMTTFKIRSIADFKAKKFRAVGTSNEFIANLGGIPVNISSADTYTALQKGTIVGVSGNPAFAIQTSKFHEVIKQATNTRNGDYAAWIGAAINVDVYNSLPDIAKKAISDLETATPEYFSAITAKASNQAFDLLKQKGIDIVQVSPEAAKQWHKLINAPAMWDKYMKEAEAKGYNPRPILNRLIAIARDHDAKNPSKTEIERWDQANPGYVKYIK